MKILITIMTLVVAGCAALAPQIPAAGNTTEDAIQRYVFLHLSDQRPSLLSTPEIEVSTVDNNDSLIVTVSQPASSPTPAKLSIGGIPIENYRREKQGGLLIFIDSSFFPQTDHSFIFPLGGWPHWFSLTIDSSTGEVIDHHRPETM